MSSDVMLYEKGREYIPSNSERAEFLPFFDMAKVLASDLVSKIRNGVPSLAANERAGVNERSVAKL